MSENARDVLAMACFKTIIGYEEEMMPSYREKVSGDVLAALDRAGFAVVPKGVGITADGHEGAIVPFEPTDAMLRAAHDAVALCALGAAIEYGHQTGDWTKKAAVTNHQSCAELARDQYLAMIEAAQKS